MRALRKLIGIKNNEFNFAATAPMLKPAYRVMKRAAKENLSPLREHLGKWIADLEAARSRIARLIGASSDEIAFMPNSSTALSVAAQSIVWEKNDKVLFLADEFPSNRLVWENLVETIIIEPDPRKTFLNQLKELDLSDVRLIALSAISFEDGRLFPIAEIARFCHKKGIYLCLDAIQAVGVIPVDVQNGDAIFLLAEGKNGYSDLLGAVFYIFGKSFCPICMYLLPDGRAKKLQEILLRLWNSLIVPAVSNQACSRLDLSPVWEKAWRNWKNLDGSAFFQKFKRGALSWNRLFPAASIRGAERSWEEGLFLLNLHTKSRQIFPLQLFIELDIPDFPFML